MTVTYVDVLINSVGAVTQKKFKLRITDTFYKKKGMCYFACFSRLESNTFTLLGTL